MARVPFVPSSSPRLHLKGTITFRTTCGAHPLSECFGGGCAWPALALVSWPAWAVSDARIRREECPSQSCTCHSLEWPATDWTRRGINGKMTVETVGWQRVSGCPPWTIFPVPLDAAPRPLTYQSPIAICRIKKASAISPKGFPFLLSGQPSQN